MSGRNLFFYVLIWLCVGSLMTRSFAQTITTGSFTPSTVCPGGTITVTYTTSGTFAAGNSFSAQLSDANGSFTGNPAVIGSVTSTTAVMISATIPATTVNGSYKIRVVSSNPARTGTTSSQTLTINTPSAPGTSPVSYCVGQSASALTAKATDGASLKWYDIATGGIPSSVSPTPSTTAVGNKTYYVSQTLNGGCESPRASLIVTVNSTPGAPVVAPAPTYCQNQIALPLSATASGGATLNWYNPNQTSSSSAPIPNTGQSGQFTYFVSQSTGSCESARIPIPVTIKSTPTPPATTSAITYCQNQAATQLTATASGGATLNWYGASGPSSATAPTPNTSQAGPGTYYVSQTLNGCESPRVTITITVNPTPGLPGVTPASFCQNSPASQLVAGASPNGVLNWYGPDGTPLATAPTPPTNATATFTYSVSQSVNGCEGSKATLTVTIKPLPAPPIGNTPPPYCQTAPANPLSASGQNLLWYERNQNGGIGSPVANIPNTANSGSATYYVTQTVNGCESTRTGITVVVKVKPAPPVAPAIEFCQGSPVPILTASLTASATANWYGTNPTSGTATATAPIPSNTTPGITLYYVSQTLEGCESDRASLSVRVKALPAAPGVAPVGFCNNGPASALSANGSNLKWYDASDNLLGGAAPTPGTGTVGDQVFKVSQTVENCEGSKANLIVTIKPLPAAPGVTNLNYCLPTQDQLAQSVTALTANGQNLRWFNPDGNSFPSAPTPSINQTGTQTYQVSQTVNGCEGGKATLQVTVRTTTLPTIAKSLVTYCINDKSVPLEATAESGGSLRWINPYGDVSSEAPTPYTLNTSIKPDGDPFYVYQIGQNGCYSERSMIKVLVNAQPTLALISPVTSVNLGQRVALQLKFTSAAPYSYTLTDGYSGVVYKADTTISVLPRATTTYQVLTVKNSCGVGLPGNPATATITVRVPTVATSTLTSSTLCAGTSLTVPFTTTGDFNQGNAFGIELVSVADTSRKYAIPTATIASPVTAPVPLTLAGGQYYVRVKADNPEIAIVGSNSPTLLTVRSQPTATLSGTQNVYEGFPASLTLTFVGDSPWLVTYADSVSSYSITATSNPYALEVRPSRSTTYRLVDVTNACGTGPVSGTATVSVLPLLGIEHNPLDPLVKTYPVPTTSTLTVELDLPLTRNPATLSLTDMSGRSVLQQTTQNRKQELDLTAHPNGVYLLHIQVGDRQTVRKVLKQ